MDTETFNLNVRNPFAIPGGKRYIYGTEFKTIECQEANFNNEISSTAQEVNFPLRGENVVWSFTRDTGFEVLLAIDKKVGNNDWTPVEATDANQVFLRPDFMNFALANCKLMAYDRPVLSPCEGYQLSNGVTFSAIKAFMGEHHFSEQHPLVNDLAQFNHWDKTKYRLDGQAEGQKLYQTLFEKFYKDNTDESNFHKYFYRPTCFPFFQQGFDASKNIGIFALEGKDSADRRLSMKVILPDMERRTCFGYVKDNAVTKYRMLIKSIKLVVKRGILLDSFVKTIPKQIKYNLLRWKVYHKDLNGPHTTIDFNFYGVFMPSSILLYCTTKYNLTKEEALQHDAKAKASDCFKDVKVQNAKFYFDGQEITDGAEDGPLGFRDDDYQRLHIYRTFFDNGITEDPKRHISYQDFFDATKNRYYFYYLPLNSYSSRESGAPFYQPKATFSPTRFSKKADARLLVDTSSVLYPDEYEVVVYLFYHVDAHLNVAKVHIEDPLV